MLLILTHTHTHSHSPTAIGCYARYQPFRSNWGLGVLLKDTSKHPGWDRTGYPTTARQLLLPPKPSHLATPSCPLLGAQCLASSVLSSLVVEVFPAWCVGRCSLWIKCSDSVVLFPAGWTGLSWFCTKYLSCSTLPCCLHRP